MYIEVYDEGLHSLLLSKGCKNISKAKDLKGNIVWTMRLNGVFLNTEYAEYEGKYKVLDFVRLNF